MDIEKTSKNLLDKTHVQWRGITSCQHASAVIKRSQTTENIVLGTHLRQPKYILLKRTFSSERSRRNEDQVADNVHGNIRNCDISDAVTLFRCAEDSHCAMDTWTPTFSKRHYKKKKMRVRSSRCSFHFHHHADGGKAAASNDADRGLGRISFLFLPFSANEKRTFVTFVGWDADKRTVPFPFRRPLSFCYGKSPSSILRNSIHLELLEREFYLCKSAIPWDLSYKQPGILLS